MTVMTLDVTVEQPHPVTAALTAAALDEVDYPMLVVAADLRLRHANRIGASLLRAGRPLRMDRGPGAVPIIAAGEPGAQERLQRAVAAAAERGLRTLLPPSQGSASGAISVVPLGPGQAMLILAKPGLCQDLTLSFYAREQCLTEVETDVLVGLCAGDSPEEIAARRGVALCTVRTQIGSLRAKTGSPDIPALLRTMASLPPLVKVSQV